MQIKNDQRRKRNKLKSGETNGIHRFGLKKKAVCKIKTNRSEHSSIKLMQVPWSLIESNENVKEKQKPNENSFTYTSISSIYCIDMADFCTLELLLLNSI